MIDQVFMTDQNKGMDWLGHCFYFSYLCVLTTICTLINTLYLYVNEFLQHTINTNHALCLYTQQTKYFKNKFQTFFLNLCL